ncbi:MAG: RecQ family ATP-dependent DNA helicase [Clostridium sp.]|nr:RecQ family ATP-dependent DNA helicase [Prevotella sp.]MCM1429218.1 RecQ family ATP-dependent DNA helicase [Clostridium sp.]
MKTPDSLLSPEDILKRHWGYDSFRSLQREIIDSVLSGHDTLGLMPTGGGKSITFQVAGLKTGFVTLVVTPLISLMKDQVDNLRRRRIDAVYFHSSMTAAEIRIAWERIHNNRAKFIYVAPERLANDRFIIDLKHIKVGLIVVDEAHCISQWGYDFRPAYLNIKNLRKIFPNIHVLALTATATPDVVNDICYQLDFRHGKTLSMSFIRSNISYVVRSSESKYYDVHHILKRTSGSAIIYVRSRKRTREIAEYLSSEGISATFYHAGLKFEQKEQRQNDWQRGECRVMVATNAFGMGIDKPDVRVVIHTDLPPSLEEYYQEAGRAGRDGLPSYAVLLAAKSDSALLRRRLTEAFPSRDDIKKIYERVCNFSGVALGEGYDSIREFDLDKFCETFKLQPRFVKNSLRILGQAGYLEFHEETDMRSRLKILADREKLYELRLEGPVSDRVILQLLRLYPGLFADYVYINEDRISREGNLSPQEVYESLLAMSRQKIISYIPHRRTPILYIPTSREELKYIEIGRSIYEDRKEAMAKRVESMIDYTFNDRSCRVSRMLAYFGESSEDCGTCDVCRDKRKRNRKEDSRRIINEVTAYLTKYNRGVSVQVIRRAFGGRADDAIEALRFLCNQGFVSISDNLYFLNYK